MQVLLMSLFAALIVAADQFSKWLVVTKIPMYAEVPAIDKLFHFTHVHNYGAAFSSFSGMIWLFSLIFLVLTVAIIWEFRKKALGFHQFERWCIVAVYAGGLGNMIDRLRLGYVVDMIELEFMRFAVFNVADCFITCGCIAMMVSLIFFNKEFWKEEKK
jgi:signal peptidase II